MTKPAGAIESEQYPVPDEAGHSETNPTQFAVQSVPNVNESDSGIEQALSELVGKQRFDTLFHVDNIVRRMSSPSTAPRSNAKSPRNSLRSNRWELNSPSPVKATPRRWGRVISVATFRLWTWFRSWTQKKLVAVYVHFYPLIQSAYQDLGTKDHFNDRLIAVIDDLLKTPDIKGPHSSRSPDSSLQV